VLRAVRVRFHARQSGRSVRDSSGVHLLPWHRPLRGISPNKADRSRDSDTVRAEGRSDVIGAPNPGEGSTIRILLVGCQATDVPRWLVIRKY